MIFLGIISSSTFLVGFILTWIGLFVAEFNRSRTSPPWRQWAWSAFGYLILLIGVLWASYGVSLLFTARIHQ